jgi:hypothetical protein
MTLLAGEFLTCQHAGLMMTTRQRLPRDSLSRLAVDRGRVGCVLLQSETDRRQRYQHNAIIGKNVPGRLAIDVRLNESVSHVVGGVCVVL